jgi:hypothetical protein
VGDAFFDVDAAQYLLQELQTRPGPAAGEPARSTAQVLANDFSCMVTRSWERIAVM